MSHVRLNFFQGHNPVIISHTSKAPNCRGVFPPWQSRINTVRSPRETVLRSRYFTLNIPTLQ